MFVLAIALCLSIAIVSNAVPGIMNRETPNITDIDNELLGSNVANIETNDSIE